MNKELLEEIRTELLELIRLSTKGNPMDKTELMINCSQFLGNYDESVKVLIKNNDNIFSKKKLKYYEQIKGDSSNE